MARKPKNRKTPPWGDILGSEPIQPFKQLGTFVVSGAVERRVEVVGSVDTAEELRRRMEQIKEHYGASDWYDLAVILASQRDVALTVTPLDSWLVGFRMPQWRGRHGVELVALVELLRRQGYTTWQAIADELRDEHPSEFYQHMTAATLKARYAESKAFVERLRGEARGTGSGRTRRARD